MNSIYGRIIGTCLLLLLMYLVYLGMAVAQVIFHVVVVISAGVMLGSGAYILLSGYLDRLPEKSDEHIRNIQKETGYLRITLSVLIMVCLIYTGSIILGLMYAIAQIVLWRGLSLINSKYLKQLNKVDPKA
jgi:hypothetical protein